MVFIKKLLILIFYIMFFFPQTQAIGVSLDNYFNKGEIYSGSTYPQSVAKTSPPADLSKLKQGKSSSRNFFGLVEVGDASIDSASKKANITKIYYIDTKLNKVYIPYFIIPIFVKQKTTIVYGE